MEEAQKGLWMGLGIFFFIAAVTVCALYMEKLWKLENVVNRERERNYIQEEIRSETEKGQAGVMSGEAGEKTEWKGEFFIAGCT